jgi:NAD(P)-dependent dehydrogenase (short-subunit alcohol dehydrogenase family)
VEGHVVTVRWTPFLIREHAEHDGGLAPPKGRTPEDVAEAALYFAAFTSATGTVLTVDGGTSADDA